MHKNGFLLFIQTMSIVGLLCSFAGCIGDKTADTPVQPDLSVATAKEEQSPVTISVAATQSVDEDQQADSLSGTCPKGHHCGSPGCPLWSDLNDNGLCDRGE